jgi:hypothetical protein
MATVVAGDLTDTELINSQQNAGISNQNNYYSSENRDR